MDYRAPLQAVIPGARGRVLAVLTGTDEELSLSVLGRLSHVSVNQIPRVVDDLAALGIVTTRRVPPTTLISLERRSLATGLLMRLSRLDEAAFFRLAELATELRPAPRSVVAFGSFASGSAGPDSDIDIAIVHSEAELATDEWAASVAAFVDDGSAALGNVISIAELTLEDIDDGALDTDFWAGVRETQLCLFGSPIGESL
ncbi:MAG: nucleotidyltransferase domain-containing protein [Acidimicrobiia bacterium]